MKIQLTPDLARATRRCIWFEPPEQAVQDIPRLAAYILTYGTPEDTSSYGNKSTTPNCWNASTVPPQASSTNAPGPIGTSSPAATPHRPFPNENWRISKFKGQKAKPPHNCSTTAPRAPAQSA